MTEQLSFDRNKTAILIMDYQNRQLSNFSGIPPSTRLSLVPK